MSERESYSFLGITVFVLLFYPHSMCPASPMLYSVDEAEKEKQEMVELMAFANLPRIQTCGHEAVYKTFYDDLIAGGFKEEMVGDVVTTLQSHVSK